MYSEVYIDDVHVFYAQTSRYDTGAAADASSPPAYEVYENETGTAILSGNMALLNDAETTGFYSESITLSAANGFEVDKCYCVRATATVNSVAHAYILGTFVVRANPKAMIFYMTNQHVLNSGSGAGTVYNTAGDEPSYVYTVTQSPSLAGQTITRSALEGYVAVP